MNIKDSNRHDWAVRFYRDGDEDKLFELYKALSPDKYNSKEAWLKWWNWQYKEYPYGIIIFVAEDDGKIIGQMSNENLELKMGNNVVKGRFPFGYAVHPEYRQRRVGSAIVDKTNELSKDFHGIVYAVPNPLGYQVAMKQGYMEVGLWKRMIRVFDWECLLSEYMSNKLILKLGSFCANICARLLFPVRKPTDINGLVIKNVTSFDDRINEFITRVSERYKITRIKSKEYLNWRYATFTKSMFEIYVAEKSGAIVGYMVLYKIKKEKFIKNLICESLFETEPIARCMISTISEQCRKEHSGWISWIGLADKAYLRPYKKQGFFSFSYKNEMRFIVLNNNPDITKKYLKNPDNWLMQEGDLDL